MLNNLEKAKNILLDDKQVLYGIFGSVAGSGIFPPHPFLNEFFEHGNDPCDQDGLMNSWQPFSLTLSEYLAVKDWWISIHPGSIEDSLNTGSWNYWVQEMLDR